MRARILLSALMVVAVSVGCGREPGPKGTPAAKSGTVVAGETFSLAWPSDQTPKACIEIPADAVPAGTEVTISLNVDSKNPSEWPAAFRNWRQESPGRTVYMPLIEFSATPAFTITNPASFFTVGICARYKGYEEDADAQEGDPDTAPGPAARIAHPSGGQTLELLEWAESPCQCPGSNQGQRGALGRASAVLAGTPLVPERLEASALAEEGLGGKGGSFSPFGVVRP
jgi:hypothetical protein